MKKQPKTLATLLLNTAACAPPQFTISEQTTGSVARDSSEPLGTTTFYNEVTGDTTVTVEDYQGNLLPDINVIRIHSDKGHILVAQQPAEIDLETGEKTYEYEVAAMKIEDNPSPSLTLTLKPNGNSWEKSTLENNNTAKQIYKWILSEIIDYGILPAGLEYAACQDPSDPDFQLRRNTIAIIYKPSPAKALVEWGTAPIEEFADGFSALEEIINSAKYTEDSAELATKYHRLLYGCINPDQPGTANTCIVTGLTEKQFKDWPDKDCNGIFDHLDNNTTTNQTSTTNINNSYCTGSELLCENFTTTNLDNWSIWDGHAYTESDDATLTVDGAMYSETFPTPDAFLLETTFTDLGYSAQIELASENDIILGINGDNNFIELYGCSESSNSWNSYEADLNAHDIKVYQTASGQTSVIYDNAVIIETTCPDLRGETNLHLKGTFQLHTGIKVVDQTSHRYQQFKELLPSIPKDPNLKYQKIGS